MGSTLTLYINDEKLLEAEDTEFASGKFGLMVDSEGDVSFDNFSASRP